MKYSAFTMLVCAVLLAGAPSARAAAPSELRISPDGSFSASNVVVMRKAGTNLFARVTWGNIYLRLTVVTTPSNAPAVITKNNGGAASVGDIKEGDTLVIKGVLAPGGDSLVVNAREIRDLSLNVEQKTVAGAITAVAQSGVTLADKKLGTITLVPPSTVTKGARTVPSAELTAGDKVLSAAGTYDFASKTFTATAMEMYQDKSLFTSRNFEGTVKSIAGTALPASLVVTVGLPAGKAGKQDYTVYLPATAAVMSKNRGSTTLQRFTAGDKVRLYGAIRPANLLEIDAEIIRNLAF